MKIHYSRSRKVIHIALGLALDGSSTSAANFSDFSSPTHMTHHIMSLSSKSYVNLGVLEQGKYWQVQVRKSAGPRLRTGLLYQHCFVYADHVAECQSSAFINCLDRFRVSWRSLRNTFCIILAYRNARGDVQWKCKWVAVHWKFFSVSSVMMGPKINDNYSVWI